MGLGLSGALAILAFSRLGAWRSMTAFGRPCSSAPLNIAMAGREHRDVARRRPHGQEH